MTILVLISLKVISIRLFFGPRATSCLKDLNQSEGIEKRFNYGDYGFHSNFIEKKGGVSKAKAGSGFLYFFLLESKILFDVE